MIARFWYQVVNLICWVGGSSALILAVLLSSLLSFEAVRPWLDRLASGGVAEPYTPDVHFRLQVIFGGTGILLLASGIFLHSARTWLPLSSANLFRQQVKQFLSDGRSIRLNGGDLLAVFFLSAVGLAIRLFFIDQPMRYDESTSYLSAAAQPLWITVSSYYAPNNHVFHSLCVHFTCGFFGNTPWVIRLPALLSGMLLIPLSFVSAFLLYNRSVAMLTASLVATSSMLIEYSTNARGYSMLWACFLVGLISGHYVIRTNNIVGWLILAITFAVGLWTIPIMLYPISIVLVWILSERRYHQVRVLDGRLVSCLAVTALLTVMLYLPILVADGPSVLVSNRFVLPQTVTSVVSQLPTLLAEIWTQWRRDVPEWVWMALLPGFGVSVWRHQKIATHRSSLALISVVCCLLWMIAQRVVPYPRIFLFLLPVYLMAASAGWADLIRRIATTHSRRMFSFALWAVLVMFLGTLVIRNQSVSQSADTSSADVIFGVLRERMEANDLVACTVPASAPLEYYFRRNDVPVRHLSFRPDAIESPSRLFVVVPVWQSLTYEDILQQTHWADRVDQNTKQLIAKYDYATLFVVNVHE